VSRLRVVPYRRLRRVVEQAGFAWVRCEGSHNRRALGFESFVATFIRSDAPKL
jgi:hypothetical protein